VTIDNIFKTLITNTHSFATDIRAIFWKTTNGTQSLGLYRYIWYSQKTTQSPAYIPNYQFFVSFYWFLVTGIYSRAIIQGWTARQTYS